MSQQKINETEKENKENTRFFAHQLIDAQDETKVLNADLEQLKKGTKGENKVNEHKKRSDSDKLISAVKPYMELMTFSNDRKGLQTPMQM